MITDTDKSARAKAIAAEKRREADAENDAIGALLTEMDQIRQERSMSTRMIAQRLAQRYRTSFRRGDTPVQATVHLNPDWRLDLGTTAIADKLSARLKPKLPGENFTINVRFFDGIISAIDEHDDMSFFPDGTVTVTKLSL